MIDPVKGAKMAENETTVLNKILTLLAVNGEVARADLKWLHNNEYAIKKTLQRNEGVLMVSGPGNNRIIRGSIQKKENGVPVIVHRMNQIEEGLGDMWLKSYSVYRLPNAPERQIRSAKIARVLIMAEKAGYETRPWKRPVPNIKSTVPTLLPHNIYTSKEIKRVYTLEGSRKEGLSQNESNGSRIDGLLLTESEWYAVYSANNLPDHWRPEYERRMQMQISELIRATYKDSAVDSMQAWNICNKAILLGRGYVTAQEYVSEQTLKGDRAKMNLRATYAKVRYLPITEADGKTLSKDGVRLLRIIGKKNWEESLLAATLPKEDRVYERETAHAYPRGENILMWYDGNLAILPIIKNIANKDNRYIIRGFDIQEEFLREYFADNPYCKVALVNLSIPQAEEILGIEA